MKGGLYAFIGSVFNVQGYLSVGFTESEFTTALPVAGEVENCRFHAFTGFPPLVGFKDQVSGVRREERIDGNPKPEH